MNALPAATMNPSSARRVSSSWPGRLEHVCDHRVAWVSVSAVAKAVAIRSPGGAPGSSAATMPSKKRETSRAKVASITRWRSPKRR